MFTEEETHAVWKIESSKTQLVLEDLNKQFFVDNNDALPGTKVKASVGFSKKIEIDASSEHLALFFELHQETKGLFNSKEAILLNRIQD